MNLVATLFLQSGHNIEKLREKIHELTKHIVNVYSAAKLFPYIVEGLRSKNNRTRIECADLVGFLLENHGAEASLVFNFLVRIAVKLGKDLPTFSHLSTDKWTAEKLADCCNSNS